MMPQKLSVEAQPGDVLAFGRFMRSGSPARDKEPFIAFRKADDPFRVACMRHDDVVEFHSPLWQQFDSRRARIQVPQAARQRLEPEVLFVDSGEIMKWSALPLDLKCTLLYKGEIG